MKHTKAGRHYLTKDALAYFDAVRKIVSANGADMMLKDRLKVRCDMFPPDHRRRDLDNAWKVLADAITRAGVWEDDSQIDKLTLTRENISEELNGLVFITISSMLRSS